MLDTYRLQFFDCVDVYGTIYFPHKQGRKEGEEQGGRSAPGNSPGSGVSPDMRGDAASLLSPRGSWQSHQLEPSSHFGHSVSECHGGAG